MFIYNRRIVSGLLLALTISTGFQAVAVVSSVQASKPISTETKISVKNANSDSPLNNAVSRMARGAWLATRVASLAISGILSCKSAIHLLIPTAKFTREEAVGWALAIWPSTYLLYKNLRYGDKEAGECEKCKAREVKS